MPERVAVIAGATGIVGRRIAANLAAQGGWQVFGFSRRLPEASERESGIEYIPLDLTDREACAVAVAGLQDITHFFNASRYEHTTKAPESVDQNTQMFLNVLEPLEKNGHPLQHVHLVQGTKYYGSTAGRFPTPAKESDPRSLLNTFYFEQEDIVIEHCKAHGWSWSASRPHGICDPSPNVVRSIARLIAVYAAICRELGVALTFPGTEANYRAIYQCTDSQHLAKAIAWMATNPKCSNQAFNVTNGEFFRWERMWPKLADFLGLAVGPVQTVKLAAVMADKGAVWDRIVAKHGLRSIPYEQAALWDYGDFIFTPHWDMMSSTTKLHQFGFPDVVDTEEMFYSQFDSLRAARVIPSY